jgi:hypothetical protein
MQEQKSLHFQIALHPQNQWALTGSYISQLIKSYAQRTYSFQKGELDEVDSLE